MAETVRVVVDDKRLLALIAATKGKAPVRVVADGVNYGIYLEMGTSKMSARPCAGPAAEDIRPIFQQALRGAVTRQQVEDVVDKTAFDVEKRWKEYVIQKDVVDTGAYLNSVHVVRGETFGVEFPSMA